LVWTEDFTKLPVAAKKLIRKEVPQALKIMTLMLLFLILTTMVLMKSLLTTEAWEVQVGRVFNT
jgi:hypothetical protein